MVRAVLIPARFDWFHRLQLLQRQLAGLWQVAADPQ
jgi:hypothetical protein